MSTGYLPRLLGAEHVGAQHRAVAHRHRRRPCRAPSRAPFAASLIARVCPIRTERRCQVQPRPVDASAHAVSRNAAGGIGACSSGIAGTSQPKRASSAARRWAGSSSASPWCSTARRTARRSRSRIAAAIAARRCIKGKLDRRRHLQCGYHGFTFAADGACIKVPGHERLPFKQCRRARLSAGRAAPLSLDLDGRARTRPIRR